MTQTKIETPFGVLTVDVYPSEHRPQVVVTVEAEYGSDFRIDRMELEERRLELLLEGKWS